MDAARLYVSVHSFPAPAVRRLFAHTARMLVMYVYSSICYIGVVGGGTINSCTGTCVHCMCAVGSLDSPALLALGLLLVGGRLLRGCSVFSSLHRWHRRNVA